MTPMEQLLARQACADLMTAYCTHLDNRAQDAFVALFEPTATVRKLSPPSFTATGHEQIVQVLQARPSSMVSRHLLANVTVRLDEEGGARGEACGMVVRGTRDRDSWPMPIRGLELLVSYAMVFRHTADGWRIRDCAIQRVFDVDALPIQPPSP